MSSYDFGLIVKHGGWILRFLACVLINSWQHGSRAFSIFVPCKREFHVSREGLDEEFNSLESQMKKRDVNLELKTKSQSQEESLHIFSFFTVSLEN